MYHLCYTNVSVILRSVIQISTVYYRAPEMVQYSDHLTNRPHDLNAVIQIPIVVQLSDTATNL